MGQVACPRCGRRLSAGVSCPTCGRRPGLGRKRWKLLQAAGVLGIVAGLAVLYSLSRRGGNPEAFRWTGYALVVCVAAWMLGAVLDWWGRD